MDKLWAVSFILLFIAECFGESFPPPPRNLGQFPPPPRLIETDEQKPDVEIIIFGAPWCITCQPMKDVAKELRAEGWNVRYQDIEETPDDKWTKYHKEISRGVPHRLTLVDGKPWYHGHGARDKEWLTDWLKRAENRWRDLHGLEPVPFEAHGATNLESPVDREYFYREHWRLTPGTCGMMGCTAHGGGREKVVERVPIKRPTGTQNRVRSGGG